MGQRDDFSEKTRSIIRDRVGSHCSICGISTVGPAESSSLSTRIGRAAHIVAAAAAGPRADPTLTPEQRSSPENGIWLCANCADTVDNNGGADFSIERLHRLKVAAEDKQMQRQSLLMTKINGKISAEGEGEVVGAEIEGLAEIDPNTSISAIGTGKESKVWGLKIKVRFDD